MRIHRLRRFHRAIEHAHSHRIQVLFTNGQVGLCHLPNLWRTLLFDLRCELA